MVKNWSILQKCFPLIMVIVTHFLSPFISIYQFIPYYQVKINLFDAVSLEYMTHVTIPLFHQMYIVILMNFSLGFVHDVYKFLSLLLILNIVSPPSFPSNIKLLRISIIEACKYPQGNAPRS